MADSASERNRRYRAAHPDRAKESNRKYRATHPRDKRTADEAVDDRHRYLAAHPGRAIASRAKYRAAHRERIAEAQRLRRATNPTPRYQKAAQTAVERAVAAGRLARTPCLACGDPLSQGHHYLGYEGKHRLDVVWLCVKHHLGVHAELRRWAKLTAVYEAAA